MMDVEQIIIQSRGVSLSSDLVEACAERGIEITFLDFGGQPFARLASPNLTATAISRREQIFAYRDERGLEIARRFIQGKIANQINLVRYFGKYRKRRNPRVYAELLERTRGMDSIRSQLESPRLPEAEPPPEARTVDAMRPTLLNLEGRAAALYWECVERLLPGDFTRREHRSATDPVNVLLNYGYGILYSKAWSALTLAGLEPFAGFLHVDRPGKPSLVLDFIEEFRQPVVDRVVFAMINKKFQVTWESPDAQAAREAHQTRETEADPAVPAQKFLSKETRRALADRILERLQEPEIFERKRQKLGNIIQAQARHLAMFLRRANDYRPFVSRW